jgi:2-keto-4-pentenoate hydratase/2-oxohepta-3-ene-1,7-dioic acid hydratase in catechol pathway
VDGEPWQDSSTAEMVFDVATIVAFASRTITLEPGDVIATGTPEGVGPIRDGDTVTIEIERVGRMSVPVRQGSGGYNLALRREERT